MEKWKMIDPTPGDQIRVQIGSIYHHGIYIGDNEVVQFGHPFDYASNPDDVKVIISPIEDFLNGSFLEVKIYSLKEKRLKNKNEEIVSIALSKVGENGYNILYNNCEHFANFCVFGKKESSQVDNIHKDIRKRLGL